MADIEKQHGTNAVAPERSSNETHPSAGRPSNQYTVNTANDTVPLNKKEREAAGVNVSEEEDFDVYGDEGSDSK
jgi:hypothetical protein